MDKRHLAPNGKHSKTNNNNSASSNGSSGSCKPHTAEKVDNMTQPSLKNNHNHNKNHVPASTGTPTFLQKGNSSGGSHTQKNNGKKSKKNNTSHGAGSGSGSGAGAGSKSGLGSAVVVTPAAVVSTAPSSKKSGPVLLGMPDTPMDSREDTDPYVTKIGGVPSWLDRDLPAPSKYGACEACGKRMYLLLQAYVPLEKSPYDRVVYVWACNQRLCMRKKGSFCVVRALKLSPEYAQKLDKKAKPATSQASAPTVPATKPSIGTNPFAVPGAFEMSNALFGGAGSGFANPFAPPSNTANPFAPPPGFGLGFSASTPTPATLATPITPAAKSFASVTAKNIPQDEESSESEEDNEPIE
ncbi:hypothetical protein BGZ65_010729, partial [Modicella reniformis]